MATNTPLRSRADCNRALDARLKRHTNGLMNIRRFRFAKVLFSFVIVLVAAYGVMAGGDPNVLISTAMILGSGLLGLEVTELLETYRQGVQARDGEDP